MNVLVLLYSDEEHLIDEISAVLQDSLVDLQLITYQVPYQNICAQEANIVASLANSDVLVYFSSSGNNVNSCLAFAIREAVRLNIRVVCVGDGNAEHLDAGFASFGDCLVSDVSDIPGVLFESSDESFREGLDSAIKLKRFKCGNKE